MNNKVFLDLFIFFGCLQEIMCVDIITKLEWGGKIGGNTSFIGMNLEYAIIHHSAGTYCATMDTCKAQMRNIQSYHMDSLGWDDIGYNFGIGADGNIYEGRGYGVQGAHTKSWNNKSIGIMFIGNYNDHKPTDVQVIQAQALLAEAISLKYLSSNYTLYGHRQVGNTECPGNHLFIEIQKWSHWKNC